MTQTKTTGNMRKFDKPAHYSNALQAETPVAQYL
jgi:hypothetical protein